MDDYDAMAIATVEGRADEIDELRALYEGRLKRRLPETVIRQLYNIQRELRSRRDDLAAKLTKNEISRMEYLSELTTVLRLATDKNHRVLGDADFALVYGEAGKMPEGFIDQKLVLFGGFTLSR